ncbi:recombinase family protein [Mesorhizobium sp. WSM3866]|uniref:recombinase family protein n=1 Tax=Mesorhizobium sp. WSM3866 TaxID=422271 RepID=UPI000BB07F71|nr:recombinase family protein [Mesorhizobium sp. WSM3866]PBB44972.1 recombinase family protein [Mesorhizobium sp. WSM3866]
MVIDWSQAGTGRPKAGERERTRAAAYVRMSTEHQKYSTDNQMAVIRRYADSRQYEVVRTYTDSGKSGLRLVGRDALQALLQEVESGLADYTAILVYDVSRWGRFQDPDEAAAIELRCKHAGIVVHYCAEQFENDGSIGSSIVKTVKRAMAGEYSRELSVKVFAGQANLIRLGYRQGGTPGFGLRRVLVDQTGNHKIELARGEHKSIATDRVILVPGPADEVALVQQIYRSFVEDGLGERQIADMLNDRGVMTDLGRAWTRGAVHQVLINEKYVGNNVWGRTSFKLKQVHKRNPPEAWIRFDGAFEPLVAIEAFTAARAIIEARALRMSDETMLAKLEQVLRQKGMLTGLIIDEIDDLPSSSSYACRFGSLLRAYALVGFVPDRDYRYLEINRRLRHLHPEIMNDVIRGIAMAGGQAIQDASTDLLYINNEFSTSIVIVRCLETEAGALRWKVRLDAALNPDLTIAVRMRRGNDAPLDYYLLPRLDMHEAVLRLCEFNGLSLDCYRFDSLSHLYEMSERKQMLEVA